MTTNDNILNIYCDGGSRGNPGPAASAFVVQDPNNQIIHKQGHFLGVATNNQAEYQAVIEALKYISSLNSHVSSLNFYLDSLLVVNQINGKFKIKDTQLKEKFLEIKKYLGRLEQLEIRIIFSYVPRSQNSSADLLVNETLDNHS